MTLGLHDSRVRRRRRVRWTIAKWVIALSGIVAAGVFAYETGSTLARREVERLQEEIAELSTKVEDLQQQTTDLQAGAILAERRLKDAQKRYRQDVPTGRLAALLGLIRNKLDAGVKQSRLEFLIGAAENLRSCDDKPVTKRFLVQTPLFQGANDSVSFADNAITITASGESEIDGSGRVEAWFDPAQPITLRLTQLGGKKSEKTGKLPLHASLVIDDAEYRYNIIAGAKGFVQVTGDRCRYP